MNPDAFLSAELAQTFQSGMSLTIATRNGELEPDGTRAWAILVEADRVHATLLVHARTGAALVAQLESFPEIAVAIDRPSDSQAWQIKGKYVGSRRAKPGERREVDRQFGLFRADLEVLGIPAAVTAGWRTWPCVAIRMRVTQLFHQTPGPGAGEPMR